MTDPIPVYYVVRALPHYIPKIVSKAMPHDEAKAEMLKKIRTDPIMEAGYILVEALKPMVVGHD